MSHKYGVPVVSSSGALTVGARSNLGLRMSRRDVPTLVLYVGDYDPAGLASPHRLLDARTWAARWSRYHELIEAGSGPRSAWEEAAQATDSGEHGLTVPRLAVKRDDLANHTTSPVKPDTARQYRQWWTDGPAGRTLQLEALDVSTVVDRVRAAIERVTDVDVLRDVRQRENEGRALVTERLEAS